MQVVKNSYVKKQFKFSPKKSSIPNKNITLGKTSRVTLLGDAMHPMTTHGGLGANTALMDAFKLNEALQNEDWYQGLERYEVDLLKRGYYAVNVSLQTTRRIHTKGNMGKYILWTVGRIVKHPYIFGFIFLFILLLSIWITIKNGGIIAVIKKLFNLPFYLKSKFLK